MFLPVIHYYAQILCVIKSLACRWLFVAPFAQQSGMLSVYSHLRENESFP